MSLTPINQKARRVVDYVAQQHTAQKKDVVALQQVPQQPHFPLGCSLAFYPGWEAEVDGRASAILPANLLFRAVRIPDGAREVLFRYRPASWRTGLLGAAASALALAVWFLAIKARRRAVPV